MAQFGLDWPFGFRHYIYFVSDDKLYYYIEMLSKMGNKLVFVYSAT